MALFEGNSIAAKGLKLTVDPNADAAISAKIANNGEISGEYDALKTAEVKIALAAAALLEERGFLVAAIRPPTVPENTARLRFAFSALHEKAQIEAVAKIIKEQGWV